MKLKDKKPLSGPVQAEPSESRPGFFRRLFRRRPGRKEKNCSSPPISFEEMMIYDELFDD